VLCIDDNIITSPCDYPSSIKKHLNVVTFDVWQECENNIYFNDAWHDFNCIWTLEVDFIF